MKVSRGMRFEASLTNIGQAAEVFATPYEVTWSSDNESIVRLIEPLPNFKAEFEALADGRTTIFAKLKSDGEIAMEIEVGGPMPAVTVSAI